MAKSLFYFSQLDSTSSVDIINQLEKTTGLLNRTKKLALIPTTCGSGSEATHFSVLYRNNKKYSLADKSMYPDYTVLDSYFINNLPPRIMAYTVIDALVHGIESFWSNNATNESKEHSIKALSLIAPLLFKLKSPLTKPELQNLIQGAFFAGKAIDMAKTTAGHALSYYLTKNHDIPHGQAVGNCLLPIIEINANAKNLNAIYNIFNVENASELKNKIKDALITLDLYLNFTEMNIDWDYFLKSINLERLKNNPVALNNKTIIKLFRDN